MDERTPKEKWYTNEGLRQIAASRDPAELKAFREKMFSGTHTGTSGFNGTNDICWSGSIRRRCLKRTRRAFQSAIDQRLQQLESGEDEVATDAWERAYKSIFNFAPPAVAPGETTSSSSATSSATLAAVVIGAILLLYVL
jgi:hypothetical protein